MRTIRFIFAFVIIGLLTGCATPVPVTKFVSFEEPKSELIKKRVLVVIDDRLQTKKIEHKPINMPGMVSYEFAVGESIRYTVLGALKQKFSGVELSNRISIKNGGAYDYIVLCELLKADIEMGASIFSKHSAEVSLRFTVLNDAHNKVIENVETGSSESKMTGGEIAYQLVPLEAWSQKNSFGGAAARAWDIAVLGSVSKFVTRLAEIR